VAAELLHESEFRVMGSQAHLLIVGGPAVIVDDARRRLVELEALWSRFRSDSELSRINAASGQWVPVSAQTAAIFRIAVDAWSSTGGLFDPTVLGALESAGYDRSFDDIAPCQRNVAPTPAAAPGCAGVEISADDDKVRLPPGVRVDLGGIGKGYAADLVAHQLIAAGADGACVNLGGDVRVLGNAPDPTGWGVAVADETHPDADLAWVALTEGAVATSTRLRRQWRRGHQRQHHLIEPATGAPADGPVATVTVIAAQACWAEALAKAALIAGPASGAALLDEHEVAGLLVIEDGDPHPSKNWERYVTWSPPCRGMSRAPAV
jgi:thiamine biosynthesis lipoprotein